MNFELDANYTFATLFKMLKDKNEEMYYIDQ
jgi:hypothetical protein